RPVTERHLDRPLLLRCQLATGTSYQAGVLADVDVLVNTADRTISESMVRDAGVEGIRRASTKRAVIRVRVACRDDVAAVGAVEGAGARFRSAIGRQATDDNVG